VIAVVGFALLAAGCDLPPPGGAPVPEPPTASDAPSEASEEPSETSEEPGEPNEGAAAFPGLPEPGTLVWGLNSRTDERLAFHEERAGPAGPDGHIAMNRRVRERMTALGTDNIALAPILMSYTWNPREWGTKGSDAAAGDRVREWYDHAAGSHEDGAGARVIGLSAFESHPDADPRAWFLEGGQLEAFHDLLSDPRTAFVDQ
jgi:hypothetical protein